VRDKNYSQKKFGLDNYYFCKENIKRMENTVEEPSVPYNQPLTFDKVWLLFQETNKRFQETDQKIKELSALFTSQWGKLVESLVEGDLAALLRERGIEIDSIIPRRKGNKHGHSYEFDLIAVDDTKIVIVEVKTTLRPGDVKRFMGKLRKAKMLMPEYKDRMIIGAVGFISVEGSADKMADNLGLFVIKATGSSASIINSPDFKPREFF